MLNFSKNINFFYYSYFNNINLIIKFCMKYYKFDSFFTKTKKKNHDWNPLHIINYLAWSKLMKATMSTKASIFLHRKGITNARSNNYSRKYKKKNYSLFKIKWNLIWHNHQFSIKAMNKSNPLSAVTKRKSYQVRRNHTHLSLLKRNRRCLQLKEKNFK